ncbi:MAG: hypothetical protein AB7O24_29485 [Kofleriaceae bacterium]
MRVVILVVLATSVAAAQPKPPDKPADKPPAAENKPPPPRTPGPQDAQAIAILDKIVKGPDAAARKAAITELNHIAPMAIAAIGEWLVRPHTTDVEVRRAVLTAIQANVPDKDGRFKPPPRQTPKEKQASDTLDWLPPLLALDPATPGLGETIGDIAAIRALETTKEWQAAKYIFDAAFVDSTMIYRDECGRYLRKMHPASIPALTRESQSRSGDRKRYATFQLERLDRQDALKALQATASNEPVQIALLDAIRATRLREAVHAVWTVVNADSPRVREAARAAWMDYITIKPPAPRKEKLFLPGGQLTKEEKQLWMTYRDLADNELRTAANELLGEDYPPIEDPSLDDKERKWKKEFKIDLVDVTKRLFAHFDTERAKKDAAEWAEANAKVVTGDIPGAIAMLDRLLAANPERVERAAIATVYFQWGKQLEAKKQWAEAAEAYSKAHGLDPKGPNAVDALAAHHHTLGKSLEAQGKDGGPDFRKAIALKPNYEAAKTAAEHADEAAGISSRPTWALIGALVAAVGALALFAVAMMRRRSARVH